MECETECFLIEGVEMWVDWLLERVDWRKILPDAYSSIGMVFPISNSHIPIFIVHPITNPDGS